MYQGLCRSARLHGETLRWMVPCLVFDDSRIISKVFRVQLFVTRWTIQSTGFSRPEYWSGQPFPSPGDLPNPGIKPRSPTLQADSLPAEPQGKPSFQTDHLNKITRRHADGPPHFYHLCLQTYRLVCFDTVRIMDFLTALYKSSSFLCPELGPSCFQGDHWPLVETTPSWHTGWHQPQPGPEVMGHNGHKHKGALCPQVSETGLLLQTQSSYTCPEEEQKTGGLLTTNIQEHALWVK